MTCNFRPQVSDRRAERNLHTCGSRRGSLRRAGPQGLTEGFLKRRSFITLLGGAAGWPLAAHAQQPDRVSHIGVLMPDTESDPESRASVTAFEQELQKSGWAERRNVRIDYRWTGGKGDLARNAAAELLSLAPDVIVTGGGQGLGELRHAALTVPIVFMEIDEPIFYGFVESFAHPGRNMTGFTGLEPTVGAKWLELLNEIAPQLKRIAVIFNSRTAPGAALFARSAEAAAQKFAVEVIRAPVQEPTDIEAVMTMLAREPGGGLIFPVDSFTDFHRDLIFATAARYRLPAIYGARKIAAAGGLVSYGIDRPGQFRQAAGYVDRILRGAQASDLPVERPTQFALVINLKTAKALGLTAPPGLLATADEVIE
jgi:putative ABC transport system substrate-binding protein